MMQPCVYILTKYERTWLYTGVASDLEERLKQHVAGEGSEFTAEYKCIHLVYVEHHQYMKDAIRREKQIKKWRRAWKVELIERDNPDWLELMTGLPVGIELD